MGATDIFEACNAFLAASLGYRVEATNGEELRSQLRLSGLYRFRAAIEAVSYLELATPAAKHREVLRRVRAATPSKRQGTKYRNSATAYGLAVQADLDSRLESLLCDPRQ